MRRRSRQDRYGWRSDLRAYDPASSSPSGCVEQLHSASESRPLSTRIGSFVWRCLTGSTLAPFPHSAHRTGHADNSHRPAKTLAFPPFLLEASVAMTVEGHLNRGVPEQCLQPLRTEPGLDPRRSREVAQRMKIKQRLTCLVDQPGLSLQRPPEPVGEILQSLDIAPAV